MKGVVLFLTLLLSGCVYVNVPLERGVAGVEERVIEGEGRPKVAILDVSGILSLSHVGLRRFGKNPPIVPRIREELRFIADDPAVVALVVRIDSPGGSVTASDIIYHELASLRQEKDLPLVACIMDKGLSGGYYVALAADEIVAHPTAMVGGVGVISFHVAFDHLLEKLGVDVATVQSGENKDFWSPLRPPRPAELDRMQSITDQLQQRFLALLDEKRKLPATLREEVAGGGIYTAQRAREMGLVDTTGYLDDALRRAKTLAGVSKARVVIYRRPGAYAESIYAGANNRQTDLMLLGEAAGELLGPIFRYQFLP